MVHLIAIGIICSFFGYKMGTVMQIMQGFGASLGKGIVVGVRTDGGC